MKIFTVLTFALFMAFISHGQTKTSANLKSDHSGYERLKASFARKNFSEKPDKTFDLIKFVRERDFYRLLQTHYLSHSEGQFDTMYRTSYYYLGFNHLPNHSVEDIYNGETYMPSSRIYYYFDALDRDPMWITQYWQDTRNFSNFMRETWRYDLMDNQYLYIIEFWEETVQQWFVSNASRASYEYDSLGNILSITYADFYNDQWFPWGRVINQYDEQGRHIATTGQEWEEIDGKWTNSWREEYQLNTENEWLEVEYFGWNDFDQIWEIESKATEITWINFSELKWLTVTLLDWNGQGWENYMNGICTYNSSELLLSSTFQVWDGIDWQNDYRERYVYDQYDFTTEELSEYWDNDVWVIASG